MTTIFRARRVYASSGEIVEAFAVSGEFVMATGAYAGLRSQFPGAACVDAGSTVIVPGFNDSHMHLAMAAEDVLHLDLSVAHVRSLAVLLERVREQAAIVPAGG